MEGLSKDAGQLKSSFSRNRGLSACEGVQAFAGKMTYKNCYLAERGGFYAALDSKQLALILKALPNTGGKFTSVDGKTSINSGIRYGSRGTMGKQGRESTG